MTGKNENRQPDLLDDFWNALRADPAKPPPALLDPATADLVRDIERELRPTDPDARFVATLRTRLHRAANPASLTDGVATAIPSAMTTAPRADPNHAPKQRVTGWRGSVVRELLKLAAAIVVIALVAQMLSLLFRNNADDAQPVDPITDRVGVLPPDITTPIYQLAFSSYGADGTGKQLLLANADDSSIIPITSAGDSSYVGMSTWSPDGRFLAYVGGDQNLSIQILDVVTGETRTLSGTNNGVWPRWSPDGTTIVYLGTNADGGPDLFTIDVNGGAPYSLTNDAAGEMQPVWSPDGSLIAFAAHDSSSSDIYVIDRDGGNLRNVSNLPVDVFGPSWSPDGTRIAFNSHPNGNADIYITDLTTGIVSNITNSPESEMYAVWSPDGETLAYTQGAPDNDGLSHLWLMGADGSNRHELIANDAYATIFAVWSPDGERIAAIMLPYEREDTVNWSLVVADRDGSNVRSVTDQAAELDPPVWRPGTSTAAMLMIPVPEPRPTPTIIPSHAPGDTNELNGYLLITRRLDDQRTRLFVVPADGSPSRQLIPEGTIEGDQSDGVWSPDGSQVAVTIQVGSSADIYIVNADGSNLRQLAPATSSESVPANWVSSQTSPAWSPDGSTIAFDSNRAFDRGGQDLYVIDVDGTNLQRLTDDDLWEFSPRWSPDGSKIAFEAMGGSGDHYGNVYVMNADGSERRRLVETTGAGDPNWSPDGEWIAYSDGRFCCAVHIVRPDGTERRDLTASGISGHWPRWSPDASMLAWSARENSGSLDGVFIYDLATEEARIVSSVTGKLEWSPDGNWIAVAMPQINPDDTETGAGGLYFVRPDGSDLVLLQEIDIDEYDIMLDWGIRSSP